MRFLQHLRRLALISSSTDKMPAPRSAWLWPASVYCIRNLNQLLDRLQIHTSASRQLGAPPSCAGSTNALGDADCTAISSNDSQIVTGCGSCKFHYSQQGNATRECLSASPLITFGTVKRGRHQRAIEDNIQANAQCQNKPACPNRPELHRKSAH